MIWMANWNPSLFATHLNFIRSNAALKSLTLSVFWSFWPLFFLLCLFLWYVLSSPFLSCKPKAWMEMKINVLSTSFVFRNGYNINLNVLQNNDEKKMFVWPPRSIKGSFHAQKTELFIYIESHPVQLSFMKSFVDVDGILWTAQRWA